jgi:hypothetical protein
MRRRKGVLVHVALTLEILHQSKKELLLGRLTIVVGPPVAPWAPQSRGAAALTLLQSSLT